uniref:Uncharacterized protein n=1 Tax=Rhizophagus irregularis (strain DAOM 181602 / DAOM 197198 / MUCL 43194) TaxID=747089 RepID=U9UTT3_RHIID
MFARRIFCAADVTNSRIRFVVSSRCGLCCSSYGFGVGVCQVYQKDFELGSSIGIFESEGTSGTLSAVVRDKISDQIGILPCEHVCKFNESSTGTSIIIHQPSHKDLDNLLVGIASKNKAYEKISEDMYNIINKQTEFSSSLL